VIFGTNHHKCLIILSYISPILSSLGSCSIYYNSRIYPPNINNDYYGYVLDINLPISVNNNNNKNRSAPYALSTINFTKEFIHETNNTPSKSIATNNGGVNGTMNNSSNISVDASTNSKQSKKSSSTIKSSSTGIKSSTNTNSKARAAENNNKQHYIPQTIPVNLSISRSGKMILLGKVNLIVNGEENGESSLSVPIVSSIKDNTKKLKPIKKLKLRKNKSGGTSGEVQSNKGSEAENKGTVKMKGDSYSFGLENNAMLRVLVNVSNPNQNDKDTTANDKDDDVDFDATVQGSIEDCNEEQDEDGESMLMEGLSIEQVSSNDSSLEEHDYYASYIPVSSELRTLRTQIQQLDNTNKVLQMELATANNAISNECNMVAALHDENKVLRDELEDVHSELEELLMSRSTSNKDDELEDENEELKCQIEQLKMSLDVLPVLQDEVEKLRNELAERKSKCDSGSSLSVFANAQDVSSSSSPTSIPTSSTTTADAIAATLRIENTKLRTELIRAQSNATTLLGELNTSKSESEMLPFYERRVNELLEELKKRDLEVSCLKDELSEANARAKSSLVEGLLWDDDDEEGVEEDNTTAGGSGGGANRLSLAARKLAAAAESHVLAKHGLKARDEGSGGSESSSLDDGDDKEEPQVQVHDEEGKKLLAEIDRIYADKSADENGDTESTSTPSTEESIDKAVKGSSGEDTSSVANTEATTPERDTTAAVDSPLMRDWGSPVDQAAPSSASSEDATNDDDNTKKQGSRGIGLRGLGSRLKAAEEKMRERQQLFREQQQKVLAEQQRLAELEKQNAEPGLSDVLMARMASSRKTSDDKDEDAEQENTKESSATQDEGPQDKEEAPLSSAAGDDDSSMQVSNTLKEIEDMSNEVTRRESQQGLLLENMDSLEQEFGLRTMASHDELVPSSSGDPNKDLKVKGSTVSKEKKSKGIMSRIKKVGRKNKKSKEEGIEEKDAIEEEVDSQTQPGGSTSTEDLNKDLPEPEEEDNDSYKEFIQIISTDELDRKESTGSSAENHIGTVVAA
jgi:hypothetical protein